MTALLYYLLKVCLGSGLLFLYYHLALRNKAFHQWNRFYLLSAVALSLVLPLVQFTVWHRPQEAADILRMLQAVQRADDYLEAITIYSSRPAGISREQWITIAYVGVCAVFLGSLFLSLYKIRRLAKRYGVQRLENIGFVNTAEPGTPFSFLRYIFWNRAISLSSETGRHIFRHEAVHVEERHTVDKLFLQAVLSFFWCNPFFWLIRRELRFIHEFIADKKAVGQNGTEAFAAMILAAAYPQHHYALTNHFFQTSIKRRLAMLKKINNPRMNYASRLLVLPLVALTVLAFTLRTKSENAGLILPAPQTVATDTVPQKTKTIESVEVRGAKKQLTVYYTDGSCENLTEAEATKRGLVNNGGFTNREEEAPNSTSATAKISLKDAKKKPVLVVNGKEVDYALLSALDPKKVKSVNVLKDASAVAKYGEKGRNGVIEVTTIDGDAGTTEILEEGKKMAEMQLTKVGMDEKGAVLVEADKITVEGKGPAVYDTAKKPEPIFNKVEIEASVKMQEWRKHLGTQLASYIDKAAGLGMVPGTYTVNVRFLVEKDGSISDVKALNDPGYGLAEGAVKTVRTGPKWIPGEQNKKLVRSYHTQPIHFVISEADSKDDGKRPTTRKK